MPRRSTSRSTSRPGGRRYEGCGADHDKRVRTTRLRAQILLHHVAQHGRGATAAEGPVGSQRKAGARRQGFMLHVLYCVWRACSGSSHRWGSPAEERRRTEAPVWAYTTMFSPGSRMCKEPTKFCTSVHIDAPAVLTSVRERVQQAEGRRRSRRQEHRRNLQNGGMDNVVARSRVI